MRVRVRVPPPFLLGFGGVGGPSPIPAEGPLGVVPRHSRLEHVAGFGGAAPRQSWRRALWVLFPANPSWGLLLPLVGRSLAIPGGGACGCGSPPFLAGPVAGFGRVGGPSTILAEGPVGVVPRHSWLGPAAGFGGVGGPSPILAGGPVGAVPRHFWLRRAVGCGGLGCSLANPGGGLCRCSSPPILAGACCWLWWAGWPLANLGGGPLGCCSPPILAGACYEICWAGWPLTIPGWGVLLALVVSVVPRESCRRALWLLFPANPG